MFSLLEILSNRGGCVTLPNCLAPPSLFSSLSVLSMSDVYDCLVLYLMIVICTDRLWAQNTLFCFIKCYTDLVSTMSVPMSKDISHIVKFDGSNFQQWKFGCRLLLESLNLLDVVDGVEKLPAAESYSPKFTSKYSSYSCTLKQDTNQKLIDAWKAKNVNARHYLFATIERQHQNTLYGCQSANDMWVRLTTQHAQNAAENKHLLMQQFFEYKYHPEHSVMSHISAIELLASQLKDLNEPVTEAQVITKILVTLPPSYRHFLSVWDNVPIKNRNIQTLTQRLLKEENVTKIYNNGQADAADSAFFTNNFPSQQGNRFTRGGHNNRRNRGRSGRSTGLTSRHPYIRKCNYCGDTTHLYATCRNRLRNERKGDTGAVGETSNLANDDNKNHDDHSFHSSTQQIIRNDSIWYADSGATRHMTD
ncbi:Uncharacterized protein APZ42_025252 [Daphnia magna]|uniref:Copia protein (Gag-int-pol protein) n=1 Tax=Daphnia magna TaxID=35525 RepID=A0A164TB08_9CRUS|nr:Uncharacterized protein APZ42_025252 [Daphnia magna]